MNYKFQLGELVKVERCVSQRPGGLALITGRRQRRAGELHLARYRRILYTVLLVTGEEYEEHGELLTKVSESNEL